MTCKHSLSPTAFRLSGGALLRGLVVLAAVVVAVLLASSFFRSDEEMISDRIDDGTQALADGSDEDFLAFFTRDLTYKTGGDRESLRRDLARWRSSGLRKVFVLERRIDVSGEEADVHLVVAVGSAFLDGAKVEVDLHVRREPEGWRVSSFTWSR